MIGKMAVRHILQIRKKRKIPFTQCFNYQLHLVAINSFFDKKGISDFLNTCSEYDKFFKKPTIFVNFNDLKLKIFVEKQW